jgi:hypothetical protein
MKLRTIVLATAFALSSTFALAQAGGASAGGTAGGGSAAGGSAASGSADWLDDQREHDGKGGRVGHLAEQHPESVREYPRTQCFAKRLNTHSHGSRLGPQQVKETAPHLRGAFFMHSSWEM